MARRKYRVLRIGGWIVISIVSLILITSVVFYLGRDYFLKRAVTYLNKQQPGEVQMGQIYLIPFLNFPDVTLQLQAVKFYEKESALDAVEREPIFSLEEIGVTLDLVELIRGRIIVSEARLENGFVNVMVYEDTVTNLEKALGIRFGAQEEPDTTSETAALDIDLDQMKIINVSASMDNLVNGEQVSMSVRRFESSFSYLSGQVIAALELDVDINKIKYLTINDQIDKNIFLKGSILLDPEAHLLKVEPSSISVSGFEFETWGNLDFQAAPRVDFAYNASNEGLELLNYLFRGVLDLEELEQIGDGSIHLNGTVQGTIGADELPVIRVNGDAEDLGFRIRSLDKEVKGISFHLYATNGSKSDFSEGLVDIQGFQAHFPEGDINANITASNMTAPEIDVEIDCNVELEGMEEMFKSDFLTDLSGSIALQGAISGGVNKSAERFLHDGGLLTAAFNNVSFVINHDEGTRDSLSNIFGEVNLHDSIIGTEKLSLNFNGNHFDMGLSTENILLYLLDYNRDVRAGISISSELLNPATLLRDTAIAEMLGGEIEKLHFDAEASIRREDLDDFRNLDSIPDLEISLDSFGVSLPMLARISNVNASVSFGPDSIVLHHLEGAIGESALSISGMLSNYGALAQPDSGGVVELDFNLASDRLRAADLLTIDSLFLLPQTYLEESMKDFRIRGRLVASAAGLTYDSVSMDFGLDIEDLGWRFDNYPLSLNHFLVQVRREGDRLFIDNFQGSIGENNLKLSASLGNFTDTLLENMYGSFELYTDLIDMNQILRYQEQYLNDGAQENDSAVQSESIRLDEMEYPQIDFTVNIGELRYGDHMISDINGKFRSSREKIFYLDKLETSPEGTGTLEFNGQLNLSDPDQYSIIAELKLKGVDIGDLNLEMQDGDTILAMNDHFRGIVDARGLAEIFLTPDLKVDIPSTTAAFNVSVTDGALINFTPLQAAGKYLDSKDLNNVRFATLRNSFTLVDSRISIPIMNVESTVGQLLIQGEQGLDMSYLYLVHVPTKLAKEAARSAMSEAAKDDGEDQVAQMKRGRFIMVTVWSDGNESEVKLKDRREDYK